MSKWRRLQKQEPLNFKGTMSESYLCIDCGFDTSPGNLGRAEAEQRDAAQVAGGKRKWSLKVRVDTRSETYIVHDHIWMAAGMEPWGGCLCIGCLERRIGRRLTPEDFDPTHPFIYLPGTPLVYRDRQGELNGSFCSLRCQAWYDAGNAPVATEVVYGAQKTANGFKISCAHCRKDFESKGLRCCSGECERVYRAREENLVVLAEVGIEPKVKRRCECCAAVIPTWRNGRRVSKSVRFCSDKCRKRVVRPAA